MRVRLIGILGLAFAGFTSASHGELLTDIINEAARQAGVSSSQRNLANQVIKAVIATPPPAPARPQPPASRSTQAPVQQTEAATEITEFAGNEMGSVPLHSERGALTPLEFKVWDGVLSKEQAKLMKDKIDTILELILQTPALSTLRGFSIDQSIHVKTVAPSPLVGAHALLLVRRVDPAKSKMDASGALKGVGEGPGIKVRINDQQSIWGNYSSYVDARPELLQGFPVYKHGSEDVVVIAKPGRTPFTVLSKPDQMQYEVTYNPDYFDASRPKASIQLITITVTDKVTKGTLGDRALGTLTRQAVSQLDLKALQDGLD